MFTARSLLAPVTALLLLAGTQAQAAFAPFDPNTESLAGLPDLNITGTTIAHTLGGGGASVLTFGGGGGGSFATGSGTTPYTNLALAATVNLLDGWLNTSLSNTLTVTDVNNSNTVLLAGNIFRFGAGDLDGGQGTFQLIFKPTTDLLGFGTRHLRLLATASNGTPGDEVWSDAIAFSSSNVALDISAVPVPAPLALLGLGLIGLRVVRRRAG